MTTTAIMPRMLEQFVLVTLIPLHDVVGIRKCDLVRTVGSRNNGKFGQVASNSRFAAAGDAATSSISNRPTISSALA
jgi:hypothetical protein